MDPDDATEAAGVLGDLLQEEEPQLLVDQDDEEGLAALRIQEAERRAMEMEVEGEGEEREAQGFADVEKVANEERVTMPMLSKYERARILGVRATQLAQGAMPVVEAEGMTDPMRIAEKELAEYKTPLVIRRYLPDASFEDWAVSEFRHNNEASGSEEDDDEDDQGDDMDIDDEDNAYE